MQQLKSSHRRLQPAGTLTPVSMPRASRGRPQVTWSSRPTMPTVLLWPDTIGTRGNKDLGPDSEECTGLLGSCKIVSACFGYPTWPCRPQPALQWVPHLAVQTPPRLQHLSHLGLHMPLLQQRGVPPTVPARSRAHLVPPTFSCTISPLLAAAAAKLPQCPPAMSAAGAGAGARSGSSAAGAHSERRVSRSLPVRACLPSYVLTASASRGCRPPAQPGLCSGSTRFHGGRHNRLEDGSPRGTKSHSARASHLWSRSGRGGAPGDGRGSTEDFRH